MRFVYWCPLRWSDLDAFGHVNNARILTLMEEARVALMFNHARDRGLTSFEQGVVVFRHEIEYLRQIDYAAGPDGARRPAQVRIELWVEQVSPSRLTIAYELLDGAVVATRARSVLVPVDLSSRRPRRLSEAERAFLREWHEATTTTPAAGS